MTAYDFKTKPYAHQKEVLERSWSAKFYALFMEMGTGKSKVTIDNIGMLYNAGKIDAALIIAPKGVYDNWVRGEIPTHLSDEIDRYIMRWEPKTTKSYLEMLGDFLTQPFDGLKLFVMNVEALSTAKAAKVARDFLRKHPKNIMVVDESTTIKNRKAARTKTINDLGLKHALYRRILTGSPVTKSPMDLYSQCHFLSPKALGFTSYFAFQSRYADVRTRTLGHRSFQEIVGYRRLDELSRKLDKFSKRVLKQDCLDLPDKVYIKREVTLTPEQDKAYLQMKKLALAKLESGELATTQSVLTQIMRLQQICCGFLKDDEDVVHILKNNRVNDLMDAVEEVQGKVIIWATWTYDILNIKEALAKKYGAHSVATYYGETPQDERQDIVTRFQDPESGLRFFIGQPRTGGYGITLTAANTVIYYSNSYDLEIRLQSEDRAHRIGQKNSVTYIDLVVPGTIDEKILKALREKINISGQVLGEQARDWII